MKITIDHGALKKLLKAVVSRSEDAHAVTKEDTIVLSACAGHVFVECKGDVAGIQALVFEHGGSNLAGEEIPNSSQHLQRHAFLNFRWKCRWAARPNFLDASTRLRSAPEAASEILESSFGLANCRDEPLTLI